MAFRIFIFSFGLWLPANTRYYSTFEQAQSVKNKIARDHLGGMTSLIKIEKV
jgi:hypothetical protein